MEKKKRGALYTEKEMELFRKFYPVMETHEFQREIMPWRSVAAIHGAASKFKIKKNPEVLKAISERFAENGKISRFKKGQIPINKGKKQSEFMTPEMIQKSAATRFKKGQMPASWKPKGTESWRTDGYLWVKIDDGKKWEQKHRLIWKQHYGPIPKGFNIRFKNGITSDLRIENLYMVDKGGNMRQNTIMRYPDNVRKLIRAQHKLERTINKTLK